MTYKSRSIKIKMEPSPDESKQQCKRHYLQRVTPTAVTVTADVVTGD
jgi:hypothetical protein